MPAIITEIRYRNGPNFQPSEDYIEVRVPTGEDVSAVSVEVYNQNGSLRTVSELDGLTPTTVNGFDYYLVNARINRLGAVSLVENGTVTSFVSFDTTVSATEGAAAGPPAMTSTVIGSNGSDDTASLSSTDGTNFTVDESPNPGAPTCFVAGTRVLTNMGFVAVEEINAGMMVRTANDGLVPVRRVLSRQIRRKDLLRHPELRPVRICAGALGGGLPVRDLWVSRQHRILMRSSIAQRMFGEREVLIAATKLTSVQGIDVEMPDDSVTYFHLVFNRHQIIFSEGAATESLYPGPQALKSLDADAKMELCRIFPELRCDWEGAVSPARLIPTGKEQRSLIEAHLSQHCDLVESQPYETQ